MGTLSSPWLAKCAAVVDGKRKVMYITMYSQAIWKMFREATVR